MQLVVIAAVLALARVGHGCSFECRPKNISIPVESCGLTELIDTTICAGQCYHVVTDHPHPDVPKLTLISCKRSIVLSPFSPVFLGVADRIPSTSTIMTGRSRRSVTATGPMRWNTLRGVQWGSVTPWLPTASAPRATQETRTAVASTGTHPAACPFEMPAFMCRLCKYYKQISNGLRVFVSHLQRLSFSF